MTILRSFRWLLMAFLSLPRPCIVLCGRFRQRRVCAAGAAGICTATVPRAAGCGPPATGPMAMTATTGFPALGCLLLMRVPLDAALLGLVERAYVFHPGYWGQHVGYYGGVNYGFGYMGIGFVGGEVARPRL